MMAAKLAAFVLASLVAGQCALAQFQCPFKATSQVFPPYTLPAGSPNDNASQPVWHPPAMTGPSSCLPKTYLDIAQTFKAYVQNGTVEPPGLLRVGFHSCTIGAAASYLAGCSGGWLLYDAESSFPSNGGLDDVIAALHAIKDANDCITFADLATFAGALGAELAGGPPVAWYPGRQDAKAPGPTSPPFSASIPDGMSNAAGVYHGYTILGFTIRELVVLNGGGHTIGGAEINETGWRGSFTPFGDDWPTPSNKYFVDLMHANWTPVVVPETGKLQWELAPNQPGLNYTGEGKPVFRLPSDIAMRDSDVLAKWATVYANDEAKFTRDFQRANQRLLQLGAGGSYSLSQAGFQWKGYNGNWAGYGPSILPQLDTDP